MNIFKFAGKYYSLSLANYLCSNCGNIKTDRINKNYYCWVCGESINKKINSRQNLLKTYSNF
jgi:transposase